jgi:hypothetical protein
MHSHRIAIPLPLCALLALALSHAGTISYQVTEVLPQAGVESISSPSPAQFLQRYIYYASDFTFLANQELDIVFSAALYGAISNGTVTPGFDLMLFQPNDPPGAPGHFSALALSDIRGGEGPWSVDFIFVGPDRPGAQAFFINQYDGNGRFITTLESGSTVPAGSPSGGPVVPEPGTFVMTGFVVVGGGIWWALMRRSTGPAQSRFKDIVNFEKGKCG